MGCRFQVPWRRHTCLQFGGGCASQSSFLVNRVGRFPSIASLCGIALRRGRLGNACRILEGWKDAPHFSLSSFFVPPQNFFLVVLGISVPEIWRFSFNTCRFFFLGWWRGAMLFTHLFSTLTRPSQFPIIGLNESKKINMTHALMDSTFIR